MKKRVVAWIYILPFLLAAALLHTGTVWPEGWRKIFDGGGTVYTSVQEGVSDPNYLYLILSDSNSPDAIEDPNRSTSLWTARQMEDPNEWVWKEAGDLSGAGARMGRLFRAGGASYLGLYSDGNGVALYRMTDPNVIKEINIDIEEINRNGGINQGEQWYIDRGDVYNGMLNVGLHKEGGGISIMRGGSNGPLSKVTLIGPLGQDATNSMGTSLLMHAGERLFLGLMPPQGGGRSHLYSMRENGVWDSLGRERFSDQNQAESVTAYRFMAEFMGKAWLLTESEGGWTLWDTDMPSPETPFWRERFSSTDPNSPFVDQNITDVTPLLPAGEYLYLGVLTASGGKVYKGYRGEAWIPVPSLPFDPNNMLSALFHNPGEPDRIYAGTYNSSGAQLLTRLVPRIDIQGLDPEAIFTGPKKLKITAEPKPNWGDPNDWDDTAKIPAPSVIRFQGLNGQQEDCNAVIPMDPNTPFLWNLASLLARNTEGVYTLTWKMGYGQDGEEVIRYISLAWDEQPPSVPDVTDITEGDRSLTLEWDASKDNFAGWKTPVPDADFTESFKGYDIKVWRADVPEPDANSMTLVFSEILSVRIPGENYVTYRLRIRSRDKAGNASQWTDPPVEGTPKPTLGWMDIVGEEGGCFISSLSRRKRNPANGRRWYAGLKGGRYKPESDKARMVYGEDKAWPVFGEIGWVPRRYLEAGLGAGYVEMKGRALDPDTLQKSYDKVTFRIAPLSMNLRILPFRDLWGCVAPYLGGGGDAWWYQEDKSAGDDRDGWKYGYHALFGARLLLNALDSRHAVRFREEYGVTHTYIVIEGIYNWIDNFGDSRLDLSGPFYQAGVIFLF